MSVELSNIKINNLSNSSSNRLYPHEQFNITGSISNNTNYDISKIQMCLIYNYQNNSYFASNYISVEGIQRGFATTGNLCGLNSPFTLQDGESTSAGTNLYTWMNNQNIRSVQSIQVKFIFTFSNGTTSEQIVTPSPTMIAINAKVDPQIKKLAFKRCDESGNIKDDGEYVLATIQTGYSNSSFYNKVPLVVEKMNGQVLASKTFSISNQTDLSYLSNFVNGITDSTIFINTFPLGKFDKGANYAIRVTLGDQYEKSVLSFVIKAYFVNVHLSSVSTGGVAFGKLSSATNGSPAFECQYPEILNNTLSVTGNVTFHNSLIEKGNIYLYNSSGKNTVMIASSNGAVHTDGDFNTYGNIGTSANISASQGTISGKTGTFDTLKTGQINDVNQSISVGGVSTDIALNGFVSIGYLKNIRAGYGSRKACSANNYVDYTFYFDPVFPSTITPAIVAIPVNIDSENFNSISCCVMYVNNAGASIRVYNTSNTSHNVAIYWMAFANGTW